MSGIALSVRHAICPEMSSNAGNSFASMIESEVQYDTNFDGTVDYKLA